MDSTDTSPGAKGPWTGDNAPCVYCGQVIGRTEDRCPHCKMSFSLAVRRASREVMGDWFYLDPRNPSGRGVTFETLIKMIEKGRIRHDSIVRGPTTQQDWLYAAEAPRLAKYLGQCPHCFAEAKPEDTYCTRCQLNMNTRLGEPRPGIPADLVREPFHRAAHEMEKQLSPSAPTPAAAAAAAGAASAGPAPETPDPLKAATTVAATAAAAMAKTSPAGASRVGLMRRRGPRLWLVLVLTWVTLLVFGLGLWALDVGGLQDRVRDWFASGTADTGASTAHTGDAWMNEQLAAASAAAQAKNYARAVEIYDAIIAKTGDAATWQPRKQALLQQKAVEDRNERLAKLKERLEMAEGLASDQKFDDALAVLRNIGQEDRAWLKSRGVGVETMESAYRENQAKAVRNKQLEEKLVPELAQAAALRTAGKAADALKAYKQIATAYPADLVRKHLDLDRTITELQSQVAVVVPPTGPTPPPPGSTTLPPEQVATAIAELMNQAAALEKSQKFADAVAKLEEVKQKFEQKYWPETLEKRIRDVKAKKEALEFFGVEDPKKAPKAP
jgi:tetratricopeptide (TPR) repeat protein